MSAPSLELPPSIGLAWAKVPLIEPSEELPPFEEWPRCAQKLWNRYLKLPWNQKATRFKDRVWEIARQIRLGIRHTFNAIKFFKDHGIAQRYYEPARRDIPGDHGGYVFDLIGLPLKGPPPKAVPKRKAPATTRPTSAPTASTIAAATPTPEPPSPETEAEFRAGLAKLRDEIATQQAERRRAEEAERRRAEEAEVARILAVSPDARTDREKQVLRRHQNRPARE
jgi:hypothetical protein